MLGEKNVDRGLIKTISIYLYNRSQTVRICEEKTEMLPILNRYIKQLPCYCKDHITIVNVNKSSLVHFSNKCAHVRLTTPNLMLNAQVLNTRFLGIEIDEHLTFEQHTTSIE